GVNDLLIAHPPVGQAKLDRLSGIAERVGRLAVSLDDVGIASGLPKAVDVLWEVDPGQHRIGSPPGAPTARAVKHLVEVIGTQRLEACARAVIATVVSTPSRERAVVDAGSKALSADLRVAGLKGYGIVIGREDLTVERLSEEHAVLTATDATRLAIGERIVIV